MRGFLVVSLAVLLSTAVVAQADPIDFETYPDGTSVGPSVVLTNQFADANLVWLPKGTPSLDGVETLGGTPTTTGSVNHTPGGGISVYNNQNEPIGLTFPAPADLQDAWFTSWAGSTAEDLRITGYLGGASVGQVLLTFPAPNSWQHVTFDSGFDRIDRLELIPFSNSRIFGYHSFGTFAVDDLNWVPEPGSASVLLGAGLLSWIAGRRRTHQDWRKTS